MDAVDGAPPCGPRDRRPRLARRPPSPAEASRRSPPPAAPPAADRGPAPRRAGPGQHPVHAGSRSLPGRIPRPWSPWGTRPGRTGPALGEDDVDDGRPCCPSEARRGSGRPLGRRSAGVGRRLLDPAEAPARSPPPRRSYRGHAAPRRRRTAPPGHPPRNCSRPTHGRTAPRAGSVRGGATPVPAEGGVAPNTQAFLTITLPGNGKSEWTPAAGRSSCLLDRGGKGLGSFRWGTARETSDDHDKIRHRPGRRTDRRCPGEGRPEPRLLVPTLCGTVVAGTAWFLHRDLRLGRVGRWNGRGSADNGRVQSGLLSAVRAGDDVVGRSVGAGVPTVPLPHMRGAEPLTRAGRSDVGTDRVRRVHRGG